MSELQTDSVESEVIEPAVIENPDNGADLAAASESEHSENTEPVDEVESEASKQQAYINKQYGVTKQLERDVASRDAELETFRKADIERQAAAVGNIPAMPNEFDFDDNAQFMAAVKSRDEAIVAQTTFNNSQATYLQQEQFNQQQAAQAKTEQFNKSLTSYTAKATELGIKQDELQAAGNAVAGYGLSDDLVMHILSDSDGPLITKHLAANPQDGYQLASMSPFAVGSFLDGIKVKASALKPKTSSTPAPPTNLTGNGVDPEAGKHIHIRGAKFE